jgi:hypothetical protein
MLDSFFPRIFPTYEQLFDTAGSGGRSDHACTLANQSPTNPPLGEGPKPGRGRGQARGQKFCLRQNLTESLVLKVSRGA